MQNKKPWSAEAFSGRATDPCHRIEGYNARVDAAFEAVKVRLAAEGVGVGDPRGPAGTREARHEGLQDFPTWRAEGDGR
jgi:hypothetical protein